MVYMANRTNELDRGETDRISPLDFAIYTNLK